MHRNWRILAALYVIAAIGVLARLQHAYAISSAIALGGLAGVAYLIREEWRDWRERRSPNFWDDPGMQVTLQPGDRWRPDEGYTTTHSQRTREITPEEIVENGTWDPDGSWRP